MIPVDIAKAPPMSKSTPQGTFLCTAPHVISGGESDSDDGLAGITKHRQTTNIAAEASLM